MIPIPGVNYGDLYRFVMSLGIILLALPFVAIALIELASPGILSHGELETLILIGLLIVMALSAALGVFFMWWAFKRWSRNQYLLDRHLQAKVEGAEYDLTRKMSAQERREKTMRGIAQYRETLSSEPQSISAPEEYPHSRGEDKRMKKIDRLKNAMASDDLGRLYVEIERGALRHLSRYYNLAADLAVHKGDDEYELFDGIIKEDRCMKVIQVTLFARMTVDRHLTGLLNAFQSQILELKASRPDMYFGGILAIVSDFDSEGPASYEKVSAIEQMWNLKSSAIIKVVPIDIEEIDF